MVYKPLLFDLGETGFRVEVHLIFPIIDIFDGSFGAVVLLIFLKLGVPIDELSAVILIFFNELFIQIFKELKAVILEFDDSFAQDKHSQQKDHNNQNLCDKYHHHCALVIDFRISYRIHHIGLQLTKSR